ncbi:MAG: ATP-binding cassette domain-containing protein [Lautropia sp.]|nr:ATP-binding cassette domain-containing protein [Lautropia sp.]
MTTSASSPVLEAIDLQFAWPGTQGTALQVPRLTLRAGEHVLLLGESGSGKSTLLGLLGGVLRPDSGSVHWLGRSITEASAHQLDRLRADHIGFIFQQFNLVPYLSLEDNVLLPCRFSPLRRARAGADPRETARQLLRDLELPESAWQRPVTGLSVGQQQRAAAARALIGQPELLIADEPTSALDATNRDRLLKLLMAQLAHHDATLLVVSHDAALQPHFDRTLRMDELNEPARVHPDASAGKVP